MNGKSSSKPTLFVAIEYGDLSNVMNIIRQDPNAIYSHYQQKTPLQYALEYRCEKIFSYILENNGLTHVSGNSNLLTLTACTGKLHFLKILLSSGKLCLFYKDQCDPSKEAFEKIGREQIQYYTQDHFTHTVRLLTYASSNKESLRERLCDTTKYSEPSAELVSWAIENFPATQASKKFGSTAFLCPTLHDTFESMINKKIISLANISRLKQEDFEYALILRNTKTLTTILKLVQNNNNYPAALAVLHILNEALQKHREIWNPYVDEIMLIKKNIVIDHYKKILKTQQFSDIVVITLQ